MANNIKQFPGTSADGHRGAERQRKVQRKRKRKELELEQRKERQEQRKGIQRQRKRKRCATIAATQEGNVENDWNWDWNDDDASWWYGDWQGADDWWYDDWCDDDYSWWSDDWSYDWSETGLADQSQSQPLLQPQTNIARASGAVETAAAVMTSPVIESGEEEIGGTEELASSSNPLLSQRRVRGGIARPSQPGLLSKMFIGALMLIGVLSTGVPARVESIEQTTDYRRLFESHRAVQSVVD